MRVNVLKRIVVAGGICAVALLGLSAPVNAQPGQEKQQKDTKQQNKGKPQRLAPQDQQRLIDQQKQRLTQYRDQLNQQQRVAQPLPAQLQQQKRTAQSKFQLQYTAQLHQQQVRVQSQANYNYGRDPHFYTAPTFRYSRGGQYYETTQSGVNLLRQAVNYGYDEGVRAGMADRADHWQSDYQNSFAYQDANYGYTGFYVDRDDYNTYFREGFRRGYEDGYNGRHQYGTYSGGKGSILGAVLGAVLTFEAIRR
jgi:TolA-binding protein